MEEEPKNITHTDEPKGQSSKRKPRITKTGNTDQRSVKNQKNMSHARSELQKYIHEGKKQKSKKEELEEEEEEEEIEVIFKSPAKLSGSAPPSALPRETPSAPLPDGGRRLKRSPSALPRETPSEPLKRSGCAPYVSLFFKSFSSSITNEDILSFPDKLV